LTFINGFLNLRRYGSLKKFFPKHYEELNKKYKAAIAAAL